jgi:hypothetical protein
MYHLLMNLPVFATLGVIAVLAGPLAELSINSGAWVLERSVSAGVRVLVRCVHDRRNNRNQRLGLDV